MDGFEQRAADACLALLGERAERVTFPAGRSRRSVRVFLTDRTVIATQRRASARAAHEVHILRSLGAAGAPVPAILAWRDGWLIQQDLGTRRLTQALAETPEAAVEPLLDAAFDALSRCHAAGRTAGLAASHATLGGTREWRATFAAMPHRVGTAVGVAPPALDGDAIIEGLAPERVDFIKWDARPGNAILCEDGQVAWFDWEHGGVRSPLDDVGWLLGDEYVDDRPDVETVLLDRYLPDFGRDLDAARARDYLATFLCLHSCVRLALILSYRQRDGRWWERSKTLARDRVGVDRMSATTVCAKAGRWAEQVPMLSPLNTWFAEIGDRIGALD